jgi:hypothetical protein
MWKAKWDTDGVRADRYRYVVERLDEVGAVLVAERDRQPQEGHSHGRCATPTTEPALATEMVTRALEAGVTARWVAGDQGPRPRP